MAAISSCARNEKVTPSITPDTEVEAKVESVLKSMSLKEKAGQMVQLSIETLEDETHEAIDPAKLETIIGKYKVGSILNLMHDMAHTRDHTANMVRQI